MRPYPVVGHYPERNGKAASTRNEWGPFRPRELHQPFAQYSGHNGDDTVHGRHNAKHATKTCPSFIEFSSIELSHHPALEGAIHETSAETSENAAKEEDERMSIESGEAGQRVGDAKCQAGCTTAVFVGEGPYEVGGDSPGEKSSCEKGSDPALGISHFVLVESIDIWTLGHWSVRGEERGRVDSSLTTNLQPICTHHKHIYDEKEFSECTGGMASLEVGGLVLRLLLGSIILGISVVLSISQEGTCGKDNDEIVIVESHDDIREGE